MTDEGPGFKKSPVVLRVSGLARRRPINPLKGRTVKCYIHFAIGV